MFSIKFPTRNANFKYLYFSNLFLLKRDQIGKQIIAFEIFKTNHSANSLEDVIHNTSSLYSVLQI